MAADEKKLTKLDLIKVWAIWTGFLHGLYNYERMQGVGFAHAMIPVIKRLYRTKEEISAALKRHLVFFNTNTTTGTIAAGIIAAMEEQRANGADLSDEMINSVKTSLMGPLAGIGDSVFQGMLFPILLAMGISLGLQGSVLGPILYTVLVLGISYPLHYWWFIAAYQQGGALIERLTESGLLKQATKAASLVGLMAAGALTARYVNFKIIGKISISGLPPIDLQTQVLDKILPNLLPLALVLGIWALLRRGVRVNRIIGLVFLVGFILGYLKLLG